MKILKLAILLFMYISFFWNTYAISIPVEQVFSDIKKDYKYYNELQDLYNKWMIFPDSNWKFNPNKLLTRDEFVWIAVETSCTKCISPNTDLKLLQRYKTNPFFDVQNTNKYTYCISYAKQNSFVAWYDINHKCLDWTYKKDDSPFCTNNSITLEEALAVILRMSGILTSQEASNLRQEIRNWWNFPDLALDLKSKNADWSVYSFYPDFSKTLSYEIIDYDKSWNKKVYKLLEKTWDYLRPDKYINKEEFLLLAFKALKANSCIEKQENNLALQMQIFDKKCRLWDKKCNISNLQDPKNTYDFNANIAWFCEKGINDNWYIRRFYNQNSGEEIKKYGKYIDNYEFLKEGIWTVFLRVIDNCQNTAEVQNIIDTRKNIQNNNWLWLNVTADKVYWIWPLTTTFTSKVDGWTSPYTYKWNFWDWITWTWKDTKHIFTNPWVYEVKTIATDKNWQTSEVTTVIKVVSKTENNNTLSVSIKANPIYGAWPLESYFESIVWWNSWPYIYKWDFWDWNMSYEKDPTNIFKEKWVYEIFLYVTDNLWNISKASVVIYVTDSIDCTKDSDNDRVGDCDDKCPLIKWNSINNWCPVFEQKCNSDCSCSDWYICSSQDKNICTKDAYCIPKKPDFWTCINSLQNTGFIYWNAFCQTCPCDNYIDFRSLLKTCDSVFPAITSPDEKTIYSRWDFFQIK